MTDDNRISEIRAVLDLSPTRLVSHWDNYAELYEWADNERSRRIRAILDRPPRVFFPGETVPAGVWTVAEGKDGRTTSPACSPGPRTARFSPKLEIFMPTLAQFQAAVEQAQDARADAEPQHTEGTTP